MSTIKADNYEATTVGNTLIFKTNSVEKMRIVPDGVLTGVGVNLGGNSLALNTNGTTLHIHEPTAGRASMLHCTSAAQGIGAAKGFICGMWSDNNAYCYTYDPVSLMFGTYSAIRMTINSAGNVGIGTTSPAVALDVNGEARSSTSTTSSSNNKTMTTKDYVDSQLRIGSTVVITATNRTDYPTISGAFNIGGVASGQTTASLAGVPSGWTVTIVGTNLKVVTNGGTWRGTFMHDNSSSQVAIRHAYQTGTSETVYPTNYGFTLILVRIA